MSIGIIITIASSVIAMLATIIAGTRWVLIKVAALSNTNGRHEEIHHSMQIDIASAHDKIRKNEEDITELREQTSLVQGKLDIVIKNQEIMLRRITTTGKGS